MYYVYYMDGLCFYETSDPSLAESGQIVFNHAPTDEELSNAFTQYIVKKEEQRLLINEQLRGEAYRNESDPLFFKWQRGESTQQAWLDKVAEIKQRYS